MLKTISSDRSVPGQVDLKSAVSIPAAQATFQRKAHPMTNENEIHACVQRYYQALCESNPGMVREVFHPNAMRFPG